MTTPFVPNPLYSYGRIDTSAGEGGESLHKLNPALFGVVDGAIGRGAEVDGEGTAEDIVLVASGTAEATAQVPVDENVDAIGGNEVVESAEAAEAEVEPEVEEAEVEAEEPEVVDYAEMTGVELQDILRERGLKVSGSKDELIARLQEDDLSTNGMIGNLR